MNSEFQKYLFITEAEIVTKYLKGYLPRSAGQQLPEALTSTK